ncbi:MAG: NACHT domain-containing protein [Candidatus Aminicenantes bacterium]|nr:MAG: NACHT domain-containing protein [Candidatus Aminicenantes bacterium]
MRKYKVFLASSNELALERKEIALMISRQNNAWVEKDVYLELVVWEDLLQSFRGERIQDYFNRKMLECDIVMVLFFKKVGKFTKEEFKLAYENLKKGKKPHFLFVYFKSEKIDIAEVNEDILEIGRLKKEIQQYQQIYGTFKSGEDLILKLQRQLDQVILLKQEAVVDEADKEELAKLDLEHYKEHLQRKFRYLDFTGLNAILQKPLRLEDIYVKLRASKCGRVEKLQHFSSLLHPGDENIKTKEKYEKEHVKDFVTFFRELHKRDREKYPPVQMLILGKPGSGKTTLMKWIALQCLKDKGKFFSQFIPVFISLKDLGANPDGTFRSKNIVNLAIELYQKENTAVESFLDGQFKANRLLFLLDGLDEIGDENVRREVINWIQKQYMGQNTLVVTSRFSGIKESEGLKFRDEIPVFSLRDFEMADAEAFLQNWYRNVEIAVAGEMHIQKAIEQGEKKYKDLIDIIRDSKNLLELSVNPLLLTIIAIVHRTRAVLPRDRYKLYEECLKVMIELWNLANRKLDVSFSFENSMAHLSKIAVQLMKTNRREMDKKEIEACWPVKIEGKTRGFFLKEMVLKAGLLYESEGKYGFLHLTFQEFLAAWYFANRKVQVEILRYYDKDYWRETFKLFVNIGSAELFFDEIIEQLLKKKYWQQMRFWEECLLEVVVEGTRDTIELKFARKVIDILMVIECKDVNDNLIDALVLHYPLYQKAEHLEREAWNLFDHAPHPFVQSIGASILYKCGDKTKAELMARLKNRIEDFDKQSNISDHQRLRFLLRNNNSMVLLAAGRRNVTDFNFMLAKLKSGDIILQYLGLWGLRDLRDFMDLLYLRDLLDLLDLLELRDLRDLQYLQDLLCLRDLWAPQIFFIISSFLIFTYCKKISMEFKEKYKSKLMEHQREISQWVDRAIDKLHSLSDKKLLKYFPNTTKEELKKFRDSFAEVIANELSKGNCDILKGRELTKKKQAHIAKLVTFDEKSVEQMLEFELDSQHEEEKHTHHLKAFEILGNNNYEKLYLIIRKFIAAHPDDNIRLNALYIFKNML